MKVFIFGSSGIIGQHMRLMKPEGLDVSYFRNQGEGPWRSLDLNNIGELEMLLRHEKPNVIVNMAGENRVDVVEANPGEHHTINAGVPEWGAYVAEAIGAKFIQISTQGVFSGNNPPYGPFDAPHPITWYGKQKRLAEEKVLEKGGQVARVTFVLGVRPFQNIGRTNPLELMFSQPDQVQVSDRWFSPAFAQDVAMQIWKLILGDYDQIVHIGQPIRMSRYEIAMHVVNLLQMVQEGRYPNLKAVSHEFFEGIAPRPRDTMWQPGSMYSDSFGDNLLTSYIEWKKHIQ